MHRPLRRLNRNAVERGALWNFVKHVKFHLVFCESHPDPGSVLHHQAGISPLAQSLLRQEFGESKPKPKAVVRLSLCAKIQGDV